MLMIELNQPFVLLIGYVLYIVQTYVYRTSFNFNHKNSSCWADQTSVFIV